MGGGQFLGALLVERGVLAPEALAAALDRQAGSGRKLGEVLVDLGLLGEAALRWALAEQMDIPLVHPDPAALDPEALDLLPPELCRRYGVLPLYLAEDLPGGPRTLTLAAADPARREALADVEVRVGRPLRVVAALREEILAALETVHGPAPSEDVAVRSTSIPAGTLPGILQDPTGGALLGHLLGEVAKRGEGGLHLRSRGGEARVEDLGGAVLFAGGETWHSMLLDRLRRLGGLGERRSGAVQRGRVAFAAGEGPPALFRLAVLSGVEGEEAQLQLLRPEGPPRSLGELGFSAPQVRQVREALERPGLVWVASAGEEGLASTLFGLLREIPGTGRTVTVEEEVFYRSPDLLQLETLDAAPQGRLDVLRELKHLDFERVVVDRVAPGELGEVLQLALRKRWVLAATPEASLREGLRALASRAAEVPLYGLRLVVHQRLVPRLCPGCRVPVRLSSGERARLEAATAPGAEFFQEGSGCRACGGKGVAGARAFFEVLSVGAEEREALYGEARGEPRVEALCAALSPSVRAQVAEAAARGEVALSELWEAL